MTNDPIPATRFRTGVLIVISVLVAVANAVLSLVLVALAIPGSGSPGPGFTTIATTFLAGNIALLVYALFSARSGRKRTQVVGLLLQILTVPLCLGVALLIMSVLGISDL